MFVSSITIKRNNLLQPRSIAYTLLEVAVCREEQEVRLNRASIASIRRVNVETDIVFL
jgi:hypothetical protein